YSIGTEFISSHEAIGRITSENILAETDNPPFNMSAMDGYAVCNKSINNIYTVIEEIYAGTPVNKKIKKNQAFRVFTGSKLPAGTKSVIIQENVKTLIDGSILHVAKNFKKGEYIRKKGLDFKKNEIVIAKGKVLNARDIALLISANCRKIQVFKKPKISILATGDELIYYQNKKKDGNIYASSLYMLENLVKLSFAECIYKTIIKDNKHEIKKELNKATKSDIIITTGGVSVGKKDLIRLCLIELGYKEKFWKIMMRPGKPLLFGSLKTTPVFSLPGNPVSTYVCFLIFILPFLIKLLKLKNIINKKQAILSNNISFTSKRESYLRGFFYNQKNKNFVRCLEKQDSSLIKELTNSNCLIKVPRNSPKYLKNRIVEIILLPQLF
ncbi:MAG: molybdopterin molybdotransferase MoeA, partial [Pseudomonadota bacterium]|nr:molybdopterin molybdotransferase MoeA [Pseudomonadota bacterium]